MTTPAKQVESDRASVAFHIALVEIGVETLDEALALWASVPPTQTAVTAGVWLERAIALVLTRRSRSRDLAMAYYRLARALLTGTTVPDPRNPEPTSVSLSDLRREFALLAGPVAPSERTEPGPGDSGTPEGATVPVADDEGADDEADRILIDEIADLDAEAERLEREAEEEARLVLEALGPGSMRDRLELIDDDAPASDVDVLREEAHRKAGARQAAAAERVVMDGARGALWSWADKDRKAIGWARLSRTGTPCGWCAMLISRGAVYRSQQSAQFSDGDKYHDNCHCYAVILFTREQYERSELFALNRKYADEWPRVTQGLSGKAALSAWRYFIRQEQKAAALEARRNPTNVQEA